MEVWSERGQKVVNFLFRFFFRFAVPFLDLAFKSLTIAFDLIHLIVRQFTPPFGLNVSFQLFPLPFDLIPVHVDLLLMMVFAKEKHFPLTRWMPTRGGRITQTAVSCVLRSDGSLWNGVTPTVPAQTRSDVVLHALRGGILERYAASFDILKFERYIHAFDRCFLSGKR